MLHTMNARHGFAVCLLAVSMGLNALLGIAWAKRASPPATPPPRRAVLPTRPRPLHTPEAAPTSTSAPVADAAPQVPWRQVESDDYRAYVANLRAIGCPEWLVRDILVADVEKLYEQRSGAVSKPRDYWISGGRRRALERAEEDQRAALEAEKRSLIKELVGCEWDAKAVETWNDDLWGDISVITVLLSAFGDPKPVQLIGLVEKYEHLSSELKRKADNILLPADEANLKALGQAMQTEFGAILSPAELEEFELRLASIVTLVNDLHIDGVELTGAELREMMRLRKSVANPIDQLVLRERDLTEKAQEDLDVGVRRLLGEARFADYQRAQEGTYREVLSFTEERGLPKPVAVQVYDLRAAAEQEVERLKQDQSLTPDQQKAELATVRDAAAEAVVRTLGAAVSGDYIKHHGGWLENLAKLPEKEGQTP